MSPKLTMMKMIASLCLRLFGWRVVGNKPQDSKCLIIGAPHTSNWDFPLTLLGLSALGLRFSWVGKHTLFKGIWGRIFTMIGGIPVNRTARSGFLSTIVTAFNDRKRLILAIAPEGTRAKTDHWKAGFYQIAVQAEIPIHLGFIDYPSKTIGIGPSLTPSADLAADFTVIEEFYRDKSGKYPDKQSTIVLRPKEIALIRDKSPLSPPSSKPVKSE